MFNANVIPRRYANDFKLYASLSFDFQKNLDRLSRLKSTRAIDSTFDKRRPTPSTDSTRTVFSPIGKHERPVIGKTMLAILTARKPRFSVRANAYAKIE